VKIVIPGGSGQVGTILARHFHTSGHHVVVLSRNPISRPWRVVGWDGRTTGSWVAEVDKADVVINLAGRSVNCRYTSANRRAILNSRLESTQAVGAAIRAATNPPPVWLQACTATIYSHRFDAPNDERNGLIGGTEPDAPDSWRFSIEVATAWEKALAAADTPRTRKVVMRSAMTMSPDPGGVFDTLLWLVRRGLGGRAGDGKQFVSWIHEEDFIRAVAWLIHHSEVVGPVNVAAPAPLPNAEFMDQLRAAWGAHVGLPASRWMIELGTRLLRTESELVLKSRRVVPGRLLDSGFDFRFPSWTQAAKDLCKRWRDRNRPTR